MHAAPTLKMVVMFAPKGSAFLKVSFRGTVLELKNEQPWSS